MEIYSDFYDNPTLAQPFHALQKRVYAGLDLEWAHRHGFLHPAVVPFGLFDDGVALSILNATRMEVVQGDDRRSAIQIGTVATDPDHPGRGLARRLLEHVLQHFDSSCDVFFLFAHEEVLDFYPKFGFDKLTEHVFRCALPASASPWRWRRLDPERSEDRELLCKRFRRRVAVSGRFTVADYHQLGIWYCLKFYRDSLWYCDTTKTLLVGALQHDQLQVFDIVTDTLDPHFFESLVWPGATHAVAHFVPDRFTGELVATVDADEHLFARGALAPDGAVIRFPPLART